MNLLFCQSNRLLSKPIAFLPFSLPLPSSLLKIPNDWYPSRELTVEIKGS